MLKFFARKKPSKDEANSGINQAKVISRVDETDVVTRKSHMHLSRDKVLLPTDILDAMGFNVPTEGILIDPNNRPIIIAALRRFSKRFDLNNLSEEDVATFEQECRHLNNLREINPAISKSFWPETWDKRGHKTVTLPGEIKEAKIPSERLIMVQTILRSLLENTLYRGGVGFASKI